MAGTPRGKVTVDIPDENAVDLSIATDKACWIVVKAREFEAKDVSTVSDRGSNATDDNMISVLEDTPDDPVEQELAAFISGLSEDEQIDLVALTWLGRDGTDARDFAAIREEARRAHAAHRGNTARYLLGHPLMADDLEEGLSMLGRACSDDDVT